MSRFTAVENFSRRDVLKLFGASGGALMLGSSALGWSPMSLAQDKLQPLNLFIAVGEDDKVYLTCHRSEMGQGIRTGIPQVLADELEADWDKVVVVQGLADKRYGSQNTDAVAAYVNTTTECGRWVPWRAPCWNRLPPSIGKCRSQKSAPRLTE